MHTCITQPQWVNVNCLPIFFRVTSLALRPLYDLAQCQWSNLGGYGSNQPSPNHSKTQQSTVCIIHGMYWHIFGTAEPLNSLTSGGCGCNLKIVNFEGISRIDIVGISCEIALRWMSQDLTVIGQHWLRWWLGATKTLSEPMLTEFTRPQWVKETMKASPKRHKLLQIAGTVFTINV